MQSELQRIIKDFALYLKYQEALGIEWVPASEVKEIVKKLGTPKLPHTQLEEIRKELGECNRCSLHLTRKNIVFGAGNPNASLVLVGEAPGAEEDLAGEPFVGEAGQLLNRILNAINLTRQEVYICNVIKCRPPKNRDPKPEEIKACFPFLKKQLEVIRPRIICALGKFAAQTLLETSEIISRLRGKVFEFQKIKVVPTFHPASLLRNPQWKPAVWKDIQLIQKLLEEENVQN